MKKYMPHWCIGLVIAVIFGTAAGCSGGGGDSSGIFNTAPVANAGIYHSVVTDTAVALNGYASSDINGDNLDYSWEFTSIPAGSSAVLQNSSSARPSFTPDLPGTYSFSLVVSDGKSSSAVAESSIEAVKFVSVAIAGMGTIKIELNGQKAPITTQNFLNYINIGFYSNTIFHRVIPGFVIQGGGFTSDLVQKATGAPIKNEAANGLKNLRGTIAMARSEAIDSATSQFFINVADNASLDYTDSSSSTAYGYAVFGKVVDAAGMSVVDNIAAVTTGASDVPTVPVIITSISALQ